MNGSIPIAFRRYVGATLQFDAPHFVLEAKLPGHRFDWPRLRAASIDVAEKIGARISHGGRLLRAATLVRAAPAGLDPWSVWLEMLESVHGIPLWKRQVETHDDGFVRLTLSCPYQDAVRGCARIAVDLLSLGEEIREKTEVQVNGATWQSTLQRIAGGLPRPGQMALHAALAARNLPWVWQGDDRTHVGWGSRQNLLLGGETNSARLVKHLEGLNVLIPLYTVTGSLGKTTTTRLLAQILGTSGLRLGLALSDGAWIGDKRVREGDCIDGATAKMLLHRPDIDAAVLEVGRGGIIGYGIPYDRSDIAVLLNVYEMHLGESGVDTIDGMAAVKGLSLQRGRLAVLNLEDPWCCREGARRAADTCIWFSPHAKPKKLAALSAGAAGAVGVARNTAKAAVAITIWSNGHLAKRLSLEGVQPYHGTLGERTVEELLAAIAAAWFGPIAIEGWDNILSGLHLDSDNHSFRTSLHRRGEIFVLLDKSSNEIPLDLLGEAVERICTENNIARRIAVLTRSTTNPPEHLRMSCVKLYPMADEFICFDRPDAYTLRDALPIYAPGSIPGILGEKLALLNQEQDVQKPIFLASGWEQAQAHLRARLEQIERPTLVLINQPSTGALELNNAILAFANHG